ncbi:MAG TPA: thioredoxin domain-containing protein [Negativicutes bacterium]|nr:thioredoxin domain-containing protein [Negativicutes bacterium]
MISTEKKANRLVNVKSPYLLQHAYNPVDWYPWGDEAFEKAKREDKPIFLSIGYSTCHWCHVMERESFEDVEVAEVLNKHFVAIKVDREERPDVDHVYMRVCLALTGSGGWPLTVMMDPEKKPFFAGTYFPKEGTMGRPGLLSILKAVQHKWQEDRSYLSQSAGEIYEAISRRGQRGKEGEFSPELLDKAFKQFKEDFDADYGGFGQAPKFPSPHNLLFLMRYWYRTDNAEALDMAAKTLQGMRRGGMYDHVGYGFARYAVDDRWLVPHFEKMLYDNALLTYAYLEGYQCTGDADFARVAQETLTYILRDMTGAEGGFYSAEDADSEGEEGKFYVWRPAEIKAILGEADGELFCKFYDVKSSGNFEHSTTVLHHIDYDLKEFAAGMGRAPEEIEAVLAQCRQKLFAVRERRVHPYKDDKVLTGWNGLMIAALAKAAQVLGDTAYTEAAQRAVSFIEQRLTREDGRLMARYRDGEAAFPAYLEDYAFLSWGLIELYEATLDIAYLEKALNLVNAMRELFWDETEGGFFFYGQDAESLIARPKDLYDGAMPSGNSVAAWVLARLFRMTGDAGLETLVRRMFSFFTPEVMRHPRSYAGFLLAGELYGSSPRQVVLANQGNREEIAGFLQEIGRRFLPDAAILYHDPTRQGAVEKYLPHIQAQGPVEGRAAAYVCENFACQKPVTDPAALAGLLERKVLLSHGR